ncbi:MAG: hypothetical protein L3K08_08885, partial [Thermoplasmata archaeon]|nr:hypothetical protein [Thermoplasmata archaeon]
LDQVHQLSDQQKILYDQRQPRQEALDRTNDEHRDLGRKLTDLRHQRDAARKALDEALIALRMAQPVTHRGPRDRLDHGRPEHARPEQIRREIAQLELRQQTMALPLSEENALIDQMRLLTKSLTEAQKGAGLIEEQQERRRELEETLR